MSMPKIRCSRCAQVIEARVSAGVGSSLFLRCSTPRATAPSARLHPRAVFAVRGEYPVEARQIDPRPGYQGRQAGDEIQRLEDNVRGAVAVRCFQPVANVTVRGLSFMISFAR